MCSLAAPELNCVNSGRRRRRSPLGKTELDKKELLGCDADGKKLAPFRPSPLDHQTAVFGGHAYEETVGSFSGDVAGLKSSFHLIDSLNVIALWEIKVSVEIKHKGYSLSRSFSLTNFCLAKSG